MVPDWRCGNEMFRNPLAPRRARFYSPMRCVRVSAMTRTCGTCQHVTRAEIDRRKSTITNSRDNGVEWVLGGQRHRAEVKLILCLLLDPEFSLHLPIHKDSGLSLG